LIDNIFIEELQNIESGIVCDAGDSPIKLLMNNVYDSYFVKFHGNTNLIKRASKEARYAAADLSYSVKGDVTGLSIGHKEWNRARNCIMYVSDFTFALLPGENGINIEAVGYFIRELSEMGINFVNVVFDTFQSEQLSQFLTRSGIPNMKHSVDTTINPYMNFYSLLISDQIKAGKNIFLKNNLKSLYRIRNHKGQERIDHSSGNLDYRYFGDWETSRCGLYAKDVSDSFCNWIYMASQDSYLPTCVYEDENNKVKSLKPSESDLEFKSLLNKNFKKLVKF
jgi:hypothetical protein